MKLKKAAKISAILLIILNVIIIMYYIGRVFIFALFLYWFGDNFYSKYTSKISVPDNEYEAYYWNDVYKEYISKAEYIDEYENWSRYEHYHYTYSLIYVDANNIPELVINSGDDAAGCLIVTYRDGRLDVLQTDRKAFSYTENQNILVNSQDLIYSIKNGKWVAVEDDIKYSEPITPAKYYTQREMTELLASVDVQSLNYRIGASDTTDHYYELYVEDVTWTEAKERCRRRGGHLATITTFNQFAQIQRQIDAEDKKDINFWVGAFYIESSNYDFRWLETDSAPLQLFWAQGEPSYGYDRCYAYLFYDTHKEQYFLADTQKDMLAEFPQYKGKIGYICEYGEANEQETQNTTEEIPEKTAASVSYEMQDWEKAYAEFLLGDEVSSGKYENFDYYDNSHYTYSLIYVNDDDIPELVIDGGVEALGCLILTYFNGKIDVMQTMRLEFDYIEKQNLLDNASGKMGYYYDRIYSIENGKWVDIASGDIHENISDNGDFLGFLYEWEGEAVDEETYYKKLNTIFEMEQATEPTKYYTLEEMLSILQTGDVKTANHRYELFVQNVTWDGANAYCEANGGYLATITSEEEFERIQAQINEEDKSDIKFWVGAKLLRKPNYGFHWLEPNEELNNYNMLDHFNALFKFWSDGEPSYEGYVYLFYDTDKEKYYLGDTNRNMLSEYPEYTGKIGFICEYDY